jgi:vitamin-K-epoxide reductase (warfarin-sensitive)
MEKTISGTTIFGSAKKMLIAVIVLSVLAMGVTAYLIYLHYVPEASSVCNINESFNCDVVNKSQWSYIPLGSVEIPVSILGFLYYLGVFIGTLGVLKGWKFTKILKWFEPMNVIRLMKWLTVLGVIFALYLTYIEAFVLYTYCIFCLTQQVLIVFILALFIGIRTKKADAEHDKKGGCCCG